MPFGELIAIGGLIIAISGWVWRIQTSNNQNRTRIYERMDARFDSMSTMIKTEYVRRDVHDLINNQHESEISQIKKDLHEIKVLGESTSKSVAAVAIEIGQLRKLMEK